LAWAFCLLLGACGGGGDGGVADPVEEPGPPPDPLPLAGNSRWAAQEQLSLTDGSVTAITLYSYDAQGRRTAERHYRVVAGVREAEPLREMVWSFDSYSRIIGIVTRGPASGAVTTTSVRYGADGRLASERSESKPAGATVDVVYRWRDGRIAEVTRTSPDSARVNTTAISYGIDGRVSLWAQEDLSTSFTWRPDGRLAGMSEWSGFLGTHDFGYDAQGRHVTTSYNDDGLYFEEARLSYDPQDRLLEVSVSGGFDDGKLEPSIRARYRWEAGPCQPLIVPGAPPHIAWRMAGLVSADSSSFGCAP
jgi:hypothetical protein